MVLERSSNIDPGDGEFPSWDKVVIALRKDGMKGYTASLTSAIGCF